MYNLTTKWYTNKIKCEERKQLFGQRNQYQFVRTPCPEISRGGPKVSLLVGHSCNDEDPSGHQVRRVAKATKTLMKI